MRPQRVLVNFVASVFCFLAVAYGDSLLEGLNLPTPDVSASLSFGFNYDYLRSPLNVDFTDPQGYFSVNIPVRFSPSAEMLESVLSGISDNYFTDGESFLPSVAVKQFANTTIRVDVPMLWGVCTFSHINVMSLSYEHTTGMPSFRYAPKALPGAEGDDPSQDIAILLLGHINVPLKFRFGWESTTFGYAHRFNDIFSVALNLHRHRFYFEARGNANVEMLGKVDAEIEGSNIMIPLDYTLHNPINGDYSLDRWSPTLAAKVWRFDFLARFMFKDRAKGFFHAHYTVPFFVDPATFEIDKGLAAADTEYLLENYQNGNFLNNKTETISLDTDNDILWAMPHVFTLKYHILSDNRLSVSYSKFYGSTSFSLVDTTFGNDPLKGNDVEYLEDGLDLRVSINVDHLILLNGHFSWFFFDMGIFALDVDFRDDKNLLKDIDMMIPFGKGVMIPTLSLGGIIGTKLQFLLELNVLPLTAFKTGIVYNF